tara:strand:+ start:202 stop:327 length:126 start_codon:yes stop_codon:yes gene_type:complete
VLVKIVFHAEWQRAANVPVARNLIAANLETDILSTPEGLGR